MLWISAISKISTVYLRIMKMWCRINTPNTQIDRLSGLVTQSLSLLTDLEKTLWGLVQTIDADDEEEMYHKGLGGGGGGGGGKKKSRGRDKDRSLYYAVVFTPGVRSSSKFFFVPEKGKVPLLPDCND